MHDSSGELSCGDAPLVNDCACCALREDLVPELERLAADGLTRLAIVELWDSVEPKAMAEVVVAHGGEALDLTNVMTAVDPALVLPYLTNGDDLAKVGLAAAATDQRTVGDTWARQLEYAPVLALVDSDDADDEDRALLAQLHPTAHRVPAGSGELARLAFAGFDVEAAAAAQHPACARLPQEADDAGVTTLVWHRRRPFHPERLYQALEDLCCSAARSRGRFWLADRPDTLLAWDAAGGALCVENAGPWLASLPDAAWDMVPRCAGRLPPWTGTPSTATAASTSSSPLPASTATAWHSCSSPACSPTTSTPPVPRRGGTCRPRSTPSSTPSRSPGIRHQAGIRTDEGTLMARRHYPHKPLKSRPNPLDGAGITYIDYKDTDLLRKFVSDRGKIRSRRITRVTAQQQRQIAAAIKNAREMALLPYAARVGAAQ